MLLSACMQAAAKRGILNLVHGALLSDEEKDQLPGEARAVCKHWPVQKVYKAQEDSKFLRRLARQPGTSPHIN